MEQILFPVDFSDPCVQAAAAVADTARRFVASVAMVHVVRLPQLRSEFAPHMHHFQTVMEELAGALESYLAEEFEGIRVDRHLKTGDPAKEILTLAKTQPADLIMMPTHGFTGFRPLLLGSVTASVLHDAECPVWTTAHAGETQQHQPYRSILCAVDLGDRTVPVLRAAHLFAVRYGAALHVVHSSPPLIADEALVRYATLAAEAEIPRDTTFDLIEERDVISAMAGAAGRHAADLLVIGRGRLQGALGRLRTNAHNLIRLSSCPVLSV